MDWVAARERLGAELIGAREPVARRWRELVAARGAAPRGLEPAAAELILQAGAALADGAAPETPWMRCGGALRVDAREGDRGLNRELCALWEAMVEQIARVAFGADEEQAAADALALQLDAALRGAAAEARRLLLDEEIEDPALRFGGIKLLCFRAGAAEAAATRAA